MGAEAAIFGLNAGLNFLNNGLNVAFGEHSRQRNYYYGEKQAANTDARTRALYNDLYSPKALMKQYKIAGLSPSVMFGGTPGQGGMSGAMAPSAAVQTPYMPMSMLEAAQIANIQAQTKKTNAETRTIEGENERGLAEIANIWAEQGYKNVSAALTQEQVTQQQWQNYITGETAEFSINTARDLSEQAANDAIKGTYEIISAMAQAQVDEGTIQARIEQAITQVEFTKAETLLTKANTKLSEANRKRALAEINKWQEEIKIHWKELAVEQSKARTYQDLRNITEEQMMRSMRVLEDRLSFDQDLGNRKFLWTMVNDTYQNILGTINSVVPAPKTIIKQ